MKMTFIGGGNMAQAIIGGLLQKGFAASDITVVEVIAEQRTRLAQQLGVRAVASSAEAAPYGDIVIMAVKPQQMREVAQAVAPQLKGELVLTIAAGIRLADLSRWLGGHTQLVRCMPNMPALVSAGITGAYAAPAVSNTQRDAADRVLSAVGKVIWVSDEQKLDPVTAVSGSGPAYVFYFIEALEKAGIELGLSAEQSRTLAIETFVGAAKLAADSIDPPGTLREKVTSKGGTTEAALASMNTEGVNQAIMRAIHAANRRAGELADQLGKD
jgi:pyrroline-5-carboxylate reductase